MSVVATTIFLSGSLNRKAPRSCLSAFEYYVANNGGQIELKTSLSLKYTITYHKNHYITNHISACGIIRFGIL